MLGYKNLNQFLRTYAIILVAVIVGFFVRMAKYEEFGFDAHVNITWFSVILVTLFWESLRLVNFFLNRVFPFERHLTARIFIQLVIGVAVGLIIRSMIY